MAWFSKPGILSRAKPGQLRRYLLCRTIWYPSHHIDRRSVYSRCSADLQLRQRVSRDERSEGCLGKLVKSFTTSTEDFDLLVCSCLSLDLRAADTTCQSPQAGQKVPDPLCYGTFVQVLTTSSKRKLRRGAWLTLRYRFTSLARSSRLAGQHPCGASSLHPPLHGRQRKPPPRWSSLHVMVHSPSRGTVEQSKSHLWEDGIQICIFVPLTVAHTV